VNNLHGETEIVIVKDLIGDEKRIYVAMHELSLEKNWIVTERLSSKPLEALPVK
jgi:hypothetical protein